MPIFKLKPRHDKHRAYGDVQEPKTTTPSKKEAREGLKKILRWAGIVVGAGFIGFTIFVLIISRDLPDINQVGVNNVQSTKIFDRTGTHLLYEVYQDKRRTLLDLKDISPQVVHATIAVEDKHFYDHKGIRILSIIRGSFYKLIGRDAGSGGGSTITQQYLKLAVIGDDRSSFIKIFYRKIKEIILAIRMEQKYSKDQILALYLNEIPYGFTNYGIQSAAQSYYGKNAKDLTIAQAATLAAIPNRPNTYVKNPDALKNRRNVILNLMAEQGYITNEERDQAKSENSDLDIKAGIFDAPHFVMYVREQLYNQYGKNIVGTNGFKVITSLDYDKQKMAERIVKEHIDKFAKPYNASTGALVAIDPKTGQILAMVGSPDFNNKENKGEFNVVVDGNLQPGSSFKPFVYLAAFEKGYTPDTVLYDVRTQFDATFNPGNGNGKEMGLITMRKALQGSLNIPAVKTMYLVGYEDTIKFAERFGYTGLTGDYGLSMVIGGAELNMLEHANGYATLANNGVYNAPASILKIESDKGETLYEWKQDSKEVIKPELVATLDSVLTDNNARAFVFGSKNYLTLPGRPVAAKTGTTQKAYDAWTLGYTPSLAVGVWVGNPVRLPMKKGGEGLAGPIWNQFMREALASTTVENFPAPPPNTATKPVLRGSDGGIKLKINSLTGRIATSSTPSELIVEQTFLPPHDILYYVKRNDPRGDPPTNPADDPQFQRWEDGLQKWVKAKTDKGEQVILSEPPTEYDNGYSSELAPAISIVSPTPGQTIVDRNMKFVANATSPRGVSQVKFFIDGQYIGMSTAAPFELNYYAETLSRGVHTLKVVAMDDQGNWKQEETSFSLEVDLDPPSVSWTENSPLSLSHQEFPRAIFLKPDRWQDIRQVQIVLSSPAGEQTLHTFNTETDALTNSYLQFTWNTSPGVGTYTLIAISDSKDGRRVEKRLEVQIQ
jgi:membrane peptidoglycan carboxypeptidase